MGWEAHPECLKWSGVPPRGQGEVKRPIQRPGSGRGVYPDCQEAHPEGRSGQEVHPKSRELSGCHPGRPGVVGRPTQRDVSG